MVGDLDSTEKLTRVLNIARGAHADVYIGRAGSAPEWATRSNGGDGFYRNPFMLYQDNPASRRDVLNRYAKSFQAALRVNEKFRERIFALKGKSLGCFCLPKPCHGQVIAAFLNGESACVCVGKAVMGLSYTREDEDFMRCQTCHFAIE